MLWFAVAPLLPHWEETLGLSKAQSGIVVGAYSATILVASVPAGNLADRYGPRRVEPVLLMPTVALLPFVVERFPPSRST